MKKIIFFSFLILIILLPAATLGTNYAGALSAGYVFKQGCKFKEVYGHGMANAITADGCYHRCDRWGIGAKISYWHANGQTTFLKQRTTLQEVPFTIYIRRMKNFNCLQVYGSFGGGVILAKECSYLGDVRLRKGIGELEFGLNYPVWGCFNFTSALRYLFPKQSHCCEKVSLGGVDLRAGFEYSF